MDPENVRIMIAALSGAAVTYGSLNLARSYKILRLLDDVDHQARHQAVRGEQAEAAADNRFAAHDTRLERIGWDVGDLKRQATRIDQTTAETARGVDGLERTAKVTEALARAGRPAQGPARHTLRAGRLRAAREGVRTDRTGRTA
ncbi:hypothetical protein [Nocardiopsis trehalosi]|jgi:hypothetical protein|uniref:hypothetical protein n=1 Tax=Nocardiopsis trehalosi TaxID=109329 RepID=UPI00082BF76D|nr:hypothetical protein [Nocardiopsis trehalosi]